MKRSFLFFPLMVLFSILGCASSKQGSQAPDFILPQASDSSPVALSNLHQQTPVLLVFWASWCPSCVEEIPQLKAIYQKYPKSKLQLVAINVQESQKDVQRFIKEKALPYSVLLDLDGAVAARYDVAGLPASVLLAKGGEILYYGFSLPAQLDSWLEPRSTT